MQWTMLFIRVGRADSVEFTREALSLTVGTGQWDNLEVYAADGYTKLASVIPDSVHLTDDGLVGTLLIENEEFEATNRETSPDDYAVSFDMRLDMNYDDEAVVSELEDIYTGTLTAKA